MAGTSSVPEAPMADRFTVQVAVDYEMLSELAANAVTATVEANPRSVMTLPTGETPRGMYDELVRRIVDGRLDFSGVQFFCLDEYLGTAIDDEVSLTSWLRDAFFQPAGLAEANTHVLPSTASDPDEAAAAYDAEIQTAGGFDLAVVGIGRNGHVAFNEPGSPPDSRTRVIDLTPASREQNAAYYDGRQEIPARAMTVGLGTILEARSIVLIASGEGKAEILRQALEGPITSDVPASHLRTAGARLRVIADAAAVSKLAGEAP
ncbi:MAG: glucosamine-6-phosphate deaminase [Chloroflexia bacterium]|nr:glucosamine-6-phosphate deaminase [Chloroflexia bacterium]